MTRLADIIALRTQRNIYIQFAKNFCNIALPKRKIDGVFQVYINDYEAYSIYEKCVNHYSTKKEILSIALRVKNFFETK